MKYLAILILALATTGCVKYSVLNTCPEYFRANIGEIRREPLNPLGLFFKGMVSHNDPAGTIHLYLFADSHTLLEEAFHSFEIRAINNRKFEWEEFYHDFHPDDSPYDDYGGPVLALAMIAAVPFPHLLPGGGGYVDLYSRVSHFEDSASCFVALRRGRIFAGDEILTGKIDIVRKFANGEYGMF